MFGSQAAASAALDSPKLYHLSLPNSESGMVVYLEEREVAGLQTNAEETEIGGVGSGDEAAEVSQASQANIGKLTLYAREADAPFSGSLVRILLQKQPQTTAEVQATIVYQCYMHDNTYNEFTNKAEIFPETGMEAVLDMEGIADSVYEDIRQRIAVEMERIQPSDAE